MENKLLNVALGYLNQGLSVIPVSGKVPTIPTWSKWQHVLPTEEDVRHFFRYGEPTGIAVITGRVSGIVVVDIDDASQDQEFDTPKSKTSRGYHYYFKCPDSPLPTRGLVGIKGEIRGEGSYVVMPPSFHESGVLYEWVRPFSRDLLMELPDDFKDLEQARIESETSIGTWGELLEGVEEGSRHITATRFVGKLLSAIGKKDWHLIYPIVKSWNLLNRPPLEIKELKSIVQSLIHKENAKHPTHQKQRRVLTIKEIMESVDEEVSFLVNELIPKEGITALSGHPSSGKSWITLHLAECVAKGGLLFGKFQSEQGSVLIVDEESGKGEYRRRWQKMLVDKNLPIYLFSQEQYKVDDSTDLEELKQIIKDKEIRLVILDPFVAIHSGTENNAEDMQKVMDKLQELTKVGTTILYVHHHRKDGLLKTNRSQSLRGSSAFSGRADSHIAVEKTSTNEEDLAIDVFHEKMRRGKAVRSFSVKFAERPDKTIEVQYGGEVEEDKVKKEEAMEAILPLLSEGSGMTRKEVISAVKNLTGVGERNIIDAIKALLDIKKITEGKRGREKFYSIVNKTNVQSLTVMDNPNNHDK